MSKTLRKILAAAAACGLSAFALAQGQNRAGDFRASDYQRITTPSQASNLFKDGHTLANSISVAEREVGGHAVRAECRVKSEATGAGATGAGGMGNTAERAATPQNRDTSGAKKMDMVCMVTLLVGDSRFVEVVVDTQGKILHRDDQGGVGAAETGARSGTRSGTEGTRGTESGTRGSEGTRGDRPRSGLDNGNGNFRSSLDNGNHNYNSGTEFRSVMFVENGNYNSSTGRGDVGRTGGDAGRTGNDMGRSQAGGTTGQHGNMGQSGARMSGQSMAANQFAMPTRTQKSSDLIGKGVTNNANENLGRIEDIVVDANSGRILYAVLSFGGFLGVGDKLFAVPWQSLQLPADAEKFVFNVDKDRLRNAEGFDKNNWPDFANEQWATTNYRAFDQQPYWQTGDTRSGQAGAQSGQQGNVNWGTTTGYRQGWNQRPTMWKKLSDLDNREVRNQNNEDLGTIDDVVIDPDAGRVVYGLLDEGDEHIAVPWTALRLEQGNNNFRLNMTKEQVENVQGWTGNNWPNFTDRSWATTNYRAFNTQPYWDVDVDVDRR